MFFFPLRRARPTSGLRQERQRSRLHLEVLENRLALAFDLTISVGDLPKANNPYGITSLDNQIYASSYGTVGGDLAQFSWDKTGKVLVHKGALTLGPKLATAPPSGTIPGEGGQSLFQLANPADAVKVKVGMRAFGGLKNGGNVMPDFAIVIGVDAKTGVVKVNGNLIGQGVDGGDVHFSNTLGDQLIPKEGVTLKLPTDQGDLSSVRIIFTIGGHGWLAVDPAGGVAAPTVFNDPYYQNITWDFAEYTLNTPGGNSHTPGGTASKFTLNQSMLDQFGFPVQISVAPGISGQPDEAGVFISHDQTIAGWKSFIAQAPPDAKVVFGDLSTVQSASNRIVSPADRAQLPNLPAKLPTFFDSQIVAFFNTYDQAIHAGTKFTMFNVAGAKNTGEGTKLENQTNLHDLEGSVLTLSLTGTAATTTPGGSGQNEVQTLTFTPAVGKASVLTFNGQSTGPLAQDISAATLQTALESLSGIGTNNVSVTGASGNFTVTFQGTKAGIDVGQIDFATSSNQRVLQLTDITPGSLVVGRGDVYNVYEPFWQTNGYKTTPPSGYPYPSVPEQAPTWITPAETPGQMVFGGDGVFADNLKQTPPLNGNQQILLGAIENQIVTALNRGIVLNPYQDWLYSSKFLNIRAGGDVSVSDSGTTVTLPIGVFIPQVVPGIGVVRVHGAETAIVSAVSADGLKFTLTNSTFTDISYDDIVFTYANLPNPFYKNSSANRNPDKIWNYYTQYFHQDTVVKDGQAYAYAYDDQGSFSSTIAAGIPPDTIPTGAKILLGNAITLPGPSSTGAPTVQFNVEFLQPRVGLTKASFETVPGAGLSGTSVTSVTGSGASWTVTVNTGTGDGTLALKLLGDQPVTSRAYTIDRTAPALQSNIRANASPTAAATVSWSVTFSEAVRGVSAKNFLLISDYLSGAQITHVQSSGDGTIWTVTAHSGSGDGTLRLKMVNTSGITDVVNLPLTGLPGNGATYDIERAGATIVQAPMFFWTRAGVASTLIWKIPAFTDANSVQLTATLAVTPGANGTLRAVSRNGVTVTRSGTPGSELQFAGTVAALNAYFSNARGFITYTPALGQPTTPRTLTLSAQGSDGLSGMATPSLLVRARVQPIPAPGVRNPAPVLNGIVGQPVVITYDQLVAATGATQTASRSIGFQFFGHLSKGSSLQYWTGSRWAAVPKLVNIPLLAPGGQIRLMPPAGARGVVQAFTVQAFDGWRYSGRSRVAVDLKPVT